MRCHRTDAVSLAADLRQRIINREFDAMNRLPAVRELSLYYHASVNTVAKALKTLCAEGLLIARDRVGYDVLENRIDAKESDIVAIVVGVSQSPMWLTMLSGTQDRLKKDGFDSITLMVGNDLNVGLFVDNLKRVLALKVKGLIIVPPLDTFCANALYDILRCDIPVVFADRHYMDFNAPYVVSDNMFSAYKLTRMLTSAGHTHIGFVHTNHVMTVEERFSGFRQACYDAGLEYEDITDIYIPMHNEDLSGRFTEFSNLFLEKLSRTQVTALFTANDQIGYFVMQTLAENGYRVPQDYSVVTFDANMLMKSTPYRLTGVNQDMYGIGYKCADIVLNQISGRSPEKSSGYIVAADVFIADSIMCVHRKGEV